MCNYEELAYTEWGFVIRCRQCNRYQVCFGGIMLSLTGQEFSRLLRHLAYCYEAHAGMQHQQERSILVSLPKDGVQLVVSHSELCHLQHLTEAAETEMQVLDLLALFG